MTSVLAALWVAWATLPFQVQEGFALAQRALEQGIAIFVAVVASLAAAGSGYAYYKSNEARVAQAERFAEQLAAQADRYAAEKRADAHEQTVTLRTDARELATALSEVASIVEKLDTAMQMLAVANDRAHRRRDGS